MTEEREHPNGFYGHWAKHLIDNGTEIEDDIDIDEEEDDLGVYIDDVEDDA